MKNIIIAYPSKEVALQLRSLLEQEGFYVSHVCALGSSVLSISQELYEGVVICPSMLSDMSASRIAENLPPDFDVIAFSKNGRESYTGNLINMSLPMDRQDFINTVAILVSSKSGFTRRKENEAEIISNAKLVIMSKRSITESQAHKYLQKESMRTGKKIVDLAREIINDFTE
ncbi:MAG: ANTAR domain-containing protein [Clostridiales bacterium]|nr:ANTAR domain-containing protein [Clostridiales bacterium]